ncbi:MAG: hypothetical protein AAGA30_03240 [Planctomycetota bacterium]
MSKIFLSSLLTNSAIILVLPSVVFGQMEPQKGAVEPFDEGESFAKVLESTSSELSPEVIDEIVQIRKRLGGGTGLELDQIFKNLEPLTSPIPNDLLANHDVKAENWFLESLQACESLSVATTHRTSSSSPPKPVLKIARKMDEIAADLEDLEFYRDADSIRQQAQQLRLNLRVSKNPSYHSDQRKR